MTQTVLKTFVVLAVFVSALCGNALAQSAGESVTEEVLGPLHDMRTYQTVSPDLLHYAYLTLNQDAFAISVVHDGQVDPLFKNVSKSPVFSGNGEHFGYSADKGEGDAYFVIDGKLIGPFEKTDDRSLRFGPNGDRLIYFIKTDGKYRLVTDGEQGPPFDIYANGNPVLSPDGAHVAYLAKADDKWRLIVDGEEEVARWDTFAKGNPVFSPDSRHVAYHGVVGEWEGGDHFAVIDGVSGPRFDAVYTIVFSPDGKRVGYKARTREKAYVVVVDGVTSAEYDNAGSITPIFSPDSKHVAYFGKKDGKYRLVLDGEEDSKLWDTFRKGHPVFSPDSKRMAYEGVVGEWDGGEHYFVIDGESGPPFDKISNIVFSPDSSHVAYFGKKDGKWRLIMDGAEDSVLWDDYGGGEPVFSPDGRHWAYEGAIGEWDGGEHYAVVDGEKGLKYEYVWPFAFSADSQHLAYKVKIDTRRYLIVLDGIAGAEYDSIGGAWRTESKRGDKTYVNVAGLTGRDDDGIVRNDYVFSADGRHLAYFGRKDDKKWRLVLDGQEGPPYDMVTQIPLFVGTDQVRYLAVKDGNLLRVTQRIPADE